MTNPQPLPQGSSAWSQLTSYTTTYGAAGPALHAPLAAPPTPKLTGLGKGAAPAGGGGGGLHASPQMLRNQQALKNNNQLQLQQQRIAALPQNQQAQQLRLARAQAAFVNQQNRQARRAATAKQVRRVNIARALGDLASRSGAERAGTRIAQLPTPAGIPLMLALLAFFVFAIMPVNGSYTRLGLLWLALLGRVSLPGDNTTLVLGGAANIGANIDSSIATNLVNAGSSATDAVATAWSNLTSRGIVLPAGLGGQ